MPIDCQQHLFQEELDSFSEEDRDGKNNFRLLGTRYLRAVFGNMLQIFVYVYIFKRVKCVPWPLCKTPYLNFILVARQWQGESKIVFFHIRLKLGNVSCLLKVPVTQLSLVGLFLSCKLSNTNTTCVKMCISVACTLLLLIILLVLLVSNVHQCYIEIFMNDFFSTGKIFNDDNAFTEIFYALYPGFPNPRSLSYFLGVARDLAMHLTRCKLRAPVPLGREFIFFPFFWVAGQKVWEHIGPIVRWLHKHLMVKVPGSNPQPYSNTQV